MIEIFFRTFKQFLRCRRLFSDRHDAAEVQVYCCTIVYELTLVYTGEKSGRAMEQMVWYYLAGLSSLENVRPSSKAGDNPRQTTSSLTHSGSR